MAKLYFKYGAMDAGKSAGLIQIAHNYAGKKHTPLVLKPTTDTRDTLEAKVVSRTNIEFPAILVDVNKPELFTEIISHIVSNKSNVVLVDEAHFLPVEFMELLASVVDDHDIPVLCYGLRNSFTNTGFPATDYLLRHADKIEEIKTICYCGKKATHNMLVVDGVVVKEADSPIFVGGNESYHSVCRKCFKAGLY